MLFLLGEIVVEGQVLDSLEGPLPYAVVKVLENQKGTYTDEKGRFYLKLPDGRWTLVISAVGRKSDTIRVEGADKTVRLKVVLPASPLNLREVVITAKRMEFKKGTVEPMKFEAKILRESPRFLTSDVLKFIQDVPGVVMAADFSSKFSVRGGGPQENLVLFEDVPVFNPYHMAGLFSVFISDPLSSFTFYRSNFPPRYGGILSSVLSVEVLEPDSTYGRGAVSFLAAQVFQTFGRKDRGFLFALRRSYFDITARRFGIDFPYYFYDGIAKFHYDLKPTWRISVSALHGNDVLNLGIRGNTLYASWGNTVLAFRSRTVFGDWVNLTTLGATFFRDSLSFGFGEQSIVGLSAPMNLAVLHAHFSNVSDDREIGFGFLLDYGWGNFKQEFFNLSFSSSGKNLFFSTYVEYLIKRGAYNLSIGGRLNVFKTWFPEGRKHYNVLYANPEPRITFRYFVNPDLAIKGGIGVFHQYHVGLSMGGGQLGEVLSSFYYWTSTYGGWHPMRSLHNSLGLTGITAWGDWEVEVFYKYYPDLLLENPTPDINNIYETLFKKAKANAFGVDGYVRKDVGDLRFMLSYSFLVARVKVGDTVHPSPWDRTHSFILTASRSVFWGFRGGMRFTFQSGMPYTGVIARYDVYSFYDPGTDRPVRIGTREVYSLPYSLRYPPYHRLDLYISRGFGIKRVRGEISLSVINVYNRKNVWFYIYDYSQDPPRKMAFYQLPVFPSLEVSLTW